MRWLVAHPGPNFSVHDVYVGWVEALRELGEQVIDFNLGERLVFYDKAHLQTDDGEWRKALNGEHVVKMAMNGLAAGLFKIRPHVLLIVSGFFADGDVLDQARRSGTRVVFLMTESPYEEDRQLTLAEHADLVLLNDPTHLKRYEGIAPAVYAPHAFRPSVHSPGASAEKPSDFVFVGTGYPSRIEFFEQLDLAGLDVALAGNWMRLTETSPLRPFVVHDIDECFENAEAIPLYRASKAGLNLYRREADTDEGLAGWAVGPREIEMAACGLFFLRDPRPESDELFPMLPAFTTPDEASDLLHWWLAHPGMRQTAAEQAREAVNDRTFHHNAARLLRLLTKE